MSFALSKRKKELVKALKEGKKVFFHPLVINSGYHGPPKEVEKFWGERVFQTNGRKYEVLEGDYFTVEKNDER